MFLLLFNVLTWIKYFYFVPTILKDKLTADFLFHFIHFFFTPKIYSFDYIPIIPHKRSLFFFSYIYIHKYTYLVILCFFLTIFFLNNNNNNTNKQINSVFYVSFLVILFFLVLFLKKKNIFETS